MFWFTITIFALILCAAIQRAYLVRPYYTKSRMRFRKSLKLYGVHK